MARSKPSKLANRPAFHRSEDRTAVNITARCRAGERAIQDVLVTDVGASGCQLLGLSAGITKSDPLELWFGEAGPFAARLKWARRGLLGIEFDRPLEAELLATLAIAEPESTVVPMRRGRTD